MPPWRFPRRNRMESPPYRSSQVADNAPILGRASLRLAFFEVTSLASSPITMQSGIGRPHQPLRQPMTFVGGAGLTERPWRSWHRRRGSAETRRDTEHHGGRLDRTARGL